MAEINPASWLHNAGATHTAAQLRISVASLTSGNTSDLTTRGGISPGVAGQLLVSQNGVGTMNVDVATGIVHVPGTLAGSQGAYICINDGVVTLPIAAADGSNNRIDAVVATVRDSLYSGVDDDWLLQVITGTPAGTPVLPTIPDNSLLLAEVFVQAAVTQILDADITDRRIFLGGIGFLVVANATERDALEGKYTGLSVWRRDLKIVETFDQVTSGWIRVSPKPPDRVIYTSDGTFEKANFPGAKKLFVQAQGAGQGGRGVPATASGESAFGHGGAAGGYASRLIDIDLLPASVNVTVPAGGAGGVGSSSSGAGVAVSTRFGESSDPWRVQGDGANGSSSGMAAGTGAEVSSGGSEQDGVGDVVIGGPGANPGVRISGDTGFSGSGANSVLGVGGRGHALDSTGGLSGRAPVGFGAGGGGAANANAQAARNGANGGNGVVIVDVLYA